jgi:putative FmdB family regulatory protein
VPTYQYACTACDHRFEAVQSFSDAALTECPNCSGKLRKVFSSVGIVFKGSGFYRTDSRAGAGSTVAKSDGNGAKGESGSSGSGSSGSSDSGSAKSGGDKSGGDKSAGKSGGSKDSSSGSTKAAAAS